MNLTDLTEVLRSRAELPAASHETRMSGVQAKVTATRRRRAVAGAACVVLAVVGVVYAVIPQPGRSSEPAVPVRMFPEYQEGTRIFAEAHDTSPSRATTLRFVPKSLDLKLFTQCDADSVQVQVRINGAEPFRGGCGFSSQPGWADHGVVPGQSAEVTLTVDEPSGSGRFGVAVGEPVPVSEYPFPPRPSTLATFPPTYPLPETEIRSDPADPLRRQEMTITWPGSGLMLAQLNTPGRIRVLVNDVLVTDYSHWTYTAGGSYSFMTEQWEDLYGLKLEPGQQVRITAIPERVTGDWTVGFSPR